MTVDDIHIDALQAGDMRYDDPELHSLLNNGKFSLRCMKHTPLCF